MDLQDNGRRYAVLPPVVTENTTLGYLFDVNGCAYSRDIGRSSVIGGGVFYQFGDTFCKDQNGAFVGITSHTCSRIGPIESPKESEYTDITAEGLVDSFIPLTDDEKAYEKDQAAQGGRVTLWSFGGIAEDGPRSGRGWCWFEKGTASKDGTMACEGTGVARVFYDPADGTVCAHRPTAAVLFDASEPRWGTFSTLEEDGYIYLWGHHNERVLLARVKSLRALDKTAYEFWNGQEYVSDWHASVPVFNDMQHGAIYRSDMFAPETGIKYVLVGVNRWADSCINLGCSKTIEGPYEMFNIAKATGIDQKEGYMYCIYPHPWALKEEEGELMVSWSEHWPGGVIAAKLQFQMIEAAP